MPKYTPYNPDYKQSLKRRWVKDGVLYAELNEFLVRKLGSLGYAGVTVKKTPLVTEVLVRADGLRDQLGNQQRPLNELRVLISERFCIDPTKLSVRLDAMRQPGLSAAVQAETIKTGLDDGEAFNRVAQGAMRRIINAGALGARVQISGKRRVQRAKTYKVTDGYLKSAGDPTTYYIDRATRHLSCRQGVMGIIVTIMLPHDPKGLNGPRQPLPDTVKFVGEE